MGKIFLIIKLFLSLSILNNSSINWKKEIYNIFPSTANIKNKWFILFFWNITIIIIHI